MGKPEINHMKLHKTSNGMLLLGESGKPEYTTGKKKISRGHWGLFLKSPEKPDVIKLQSTSFETLSF